MSWEPRRQRPCLFVLMGHVDLYFVSFAGPAARLPFGVEVHAGVTAGGSHYFAFELEVFEVVVFDRAVVEKVASRTCTDQKSVVVDTPCIWVFFGFFPAIECSVKK